MRLGLAGIVALFGLSLGCSHISKPDSCEIGLVHRQISGDFTNVKKFRVKETIPLYRAQGNFKVTDNLDAYGRIDFIGGIVEDTSPLKVWAQGSMTSLGTGIHYYPFGRDDKLTLGLTAGVEGIYSSYNMRGDIGPIHSNVHDRLFGIGANVGVVGKYKINENVSFTTSATYNVTDTFGNDANANLDGFSFFTGIEFSPRIGD